MLGSHREPRSSETDVSSGGLTPRAVLLGLLCVVLVTFVTAWAEQVVRHIIIGALTFPPVAIGVLIFLTLLNRLLRRWRPRWVLRPTELLVIYIMMLLSAWTSSRGGPVRLLPLLTSVDYYATVTNRWESTFFAYLPQQLIPWDAAGEPRQPLVAAFFEGLHNGEPIPWLPWVAPLSRWTVVILLLFGSFVCLATLLRPQWSDRERLSFPLAQLPLEMLRGEDNNSFYRSWLLYFGAAIPVAIHLINLAHNINPNLPQITLQWNLRQLLFTSPPLSQMTSFYLYLSLSGIGFFFLLPTDLLFSFWFFYLFLAKGHEILLLTLGQTLDQPGHADTSLYLASAEAGGFFVLAGYLLWLARPAFVAGFRNAAAGAGEMMRYRTALFGLSLTLLGAAVWFTMAGLSFWLALMEVLVYVLVIALVMTRATAEGGMLMTEIIFTPLDVYGMLGRRQLLGSRNLTAIIFATVPFGGDMRGLALQGMMDVQKIADGVGLRRRAVHAALWIGIVASLAIGFVIHLWLNYRHGAADLSGQFSWLSGVFWKEHAAFLAGEERFNPAAPVCFLLGAGFTVLLAFLRLQFWWWPLHPLAFAMIGSWSMVVYWFPILIAWVVKSMVVRYGGLPGYAKARPFFLGLVFGEMSIAVVLTLLDAIWHIPAPFIPFD